MKHNGFTMIEILVAVTISGLIALAAIPAMNNVVRRSHLDTVTRQVVSDIREARSRAITGGWEYEVIGYHATTGGARANQYRVLGRRSSAVTWPNTEATPFNSTTQFAGPWTNVSAQQSGVRLEPSASSFTLSFGPRGTATGTAGFTPLIVANDDGSRSLTVSPTGSVRVQ